ncbi:MAG: oligosaccharide flippase family protein [Chitinophagales bacterium]|nr:oligosaccharide flippase family protein [Chitinophagales bacterium]
MERLKNIGKTIGNLNYFKAFKQGSHYFIANIFVQLLGVITIRIFTRILSVADFGTYEVFANAVKLLAILLPLNSVVALNIYMYKDEIHKKEFAGNVAMLSLLFFLIGSTIILLFRQQIATFLAIPHALIVFIPIMVGIQVLYNLFHILNVIYEKSKLNALGLLLNNLLRIIFSIGFILIFRQFEGFYARIIGEIIGTGLLSISIIWFIKEHFAFSFNLDYSKLILYQGVSMILYTSSVFILNYFDTLMINQSLGSEQAGLYSFAYKIGTIYYGLIQSFQLGFLSRYNQHLHKNEHEAITEQLKSILKLVTFITLGFILLSPEMGRILSAKNDFNDALILSPIVVLGYYLLFLFDLYNVTLFQSKKNLVITVIIFSVGILNIVLNKWLIPVYGYKIAALNTLCSFFVMFILGKAATHYLGLFSLKIKYYIGFLLLCIVAVVLSCYMEKNYIGFFYSISIKTLLITLCAGLIYWNIIKLVTRRTEQK